MTYFVKNYNKISYPIADSVTRGLYNAQIGALHAVASHFTISEDAAIITMPTGSGKTAVLMMTPFLLRSKRVLVITPSRMVRNQISDDFENLETLKEIGVVSNTVTLPKITEVKSKIDSLEKWESLRDFDVVISTPNCISPSYQDIPNPPEDLFDLILVDEAHHSPAKTWEGILNSFPQTRNVLFTATPFRRDKREIKGKFLYTYPLGKAYADKIFGQITYIPVNEIDGIDNDVALAVKAEEILKKDKEVGLNHVLMVRTDSKKRAKQLVETYKEKTHLRLESVNSESSSSRIKETLERLEKKELDGIICVDMLGEGFNFPNLKIAAIHAPHKSLEVTLQFIGRFARTNATNVSGAKFLAVPSEIEIEKQKLFREDTTWQEVIIGMSHTRIDDEVETQEILREFKKPVSSDVEIKDLSLYSLNPRNHVKVYRLSKEIDIESEISLSPPFETFYTNVNKQYSIAILISGEITRPRWSKMDKLLDIKYDLFIIYYDKERKLLFINSSRSIPGLYEELINSFDSDAKVLPTNQIRRVLKGLTNTNFFNIGMRNMRQTTSTESYRTIAGPSAQAAIKKGDGLLYRPGHAFLTADDKGEKVNIGYSSASKVWSASSSQVPALVKWCKLLAEKIDSEGSVKTNSGFDHLAQGEVVTSIPEGIISAEWDKDAFDFNDPVTLIYKKSEVNPAECHISQVDLSIDHSQTDNKKITLNIIYDGLKYPIKFTLENFFEPVNGAHDEIKIRKGEHVVTLFEYLEENKINFYTGSSAAFIGNELFTPVDDDVTFDFAQMEVVDWTGVDLELEFGEPTAKGRSIHDFLKAKLLEKQENKIVFYDHGSGEIADYLVVKETANQILFRLYHCKPSGKASPGKRLEDIYEVCCQAQKSLKWTNRKNLSNKLDLRKNKPEKFIRGTLAELEQIIEATKTKSHVFEIMIVQPGISLTKVSGDVAMSKVFGAANDFIIGGGCEKLKVLVSE